MEMAVNIRVTLRLLKVHQAWILSLTGVEEAFSVPEQVRDARSGRIDVHILMGIPHGRQTSQSCGPYVLHARSPGTIETDREWAYGCMGGHYISY